VSTRMDQFLVAELARQRSEVSFLPLAMQSEISHILGT